MSKHIYLASASPRRHEILTQMGVDHDILTVPAPEGEDEPRIPGERPQDYVVRTAHDKAVRARQWLDTASLPVRPVLTADTTVSLDNDILGKPKDIDDAKRMLKRLSGTTHQVQTAIVLIFGDHVHEAVSTTMVTFAQLSDAAIDGYVNSPEPWGKAGGYGIQGKAAMFISNINGSYSGVMGLPIYETGHLLGLAGMLRVS